MLREKGKIKIIFYKILIIGLSFFLAFLLFTPHLVIGNILDTKITGVEYKASDFNLKTKKVRLQTKDNLTLSAWHSKVDNPKATIIIISGILNPSITAFFGHAKMLNDNDYNTFLIEMRARHSSEGETIGLGYLEIEDVLAGVRYLDNEDSNPIVVMGTSMGGAVAIMAAGLDDRIKAVISLSAFSSWEDVFVDNMYQQGLPKSLCQIQKPFVRLHSGIKFGFNKTKYSPLRALEDFNNQPLLLMHSTNDLEVPFSSFQRLKTRAVQLNIKTTTFIREGSHHFITYEEHFNDPLKDNEFSAALLEFLNKQFQ
ncbi:MAG: prolyl oligopeptidase family serine peptidase [Erysipelothrix sp.]|nr:prolyl oligopeptidase family serine peptidase [Erysipelothrix sp.]